MRELACLVSVAGLMLLPVFFLGALVHTVARALGAAGSPGPRLPCASLVAAPMTRLPWTAAARARRIAGTVCRVVTATAAASLAAAIALGLLAGLARLSLP